MTLNNCYNYLYYDTRCNLMYNIRGLKNAMPAQLLRLLRAETSCLNGCVCTCVSVCLKKHGLGVGELTGDDKNRR